MKNEQARKDEKFEQRLRNVIWLAIGVSVGYTSGLVVAAIIYNYSKN